MQITYPENFNLKKKKRESIKKYQFKPLSISSITTKRHKNPFMKILIFVRDGIIFLLHYIRELNKSRRLGI